MKQDNNTIFPGLSLQWRLASCLVGKFGFNFEYQPPEEILPLLSENIQRHFNAFQRGSQDKNDHPLFLVLSGAGTGKSRFLDEFQALCITALKDSPDLSSKIESAYVFKLSFENGGSVDTFTDGGYSIGSRMLFQLTDGEDWHVFRKRGCAEMMPLQVLKLLAEIEKKKISDMTVLLMVDGMQGLLGHEAPKADSKFSVALKVVSDLVNGSSHLLQEYPFVIACCSATFHNPVSSVLLESGQWRIEIPLPSLDGNKIFGSYVQDPLISLLVSDMGGHGRALEALWFTLSKWNFKIQDCSLNDLMTSLRANLEHKYKIWVDSSHIKPIIPLMKAVLTQQQFTNLAVKLPGSIGTIDDHVKLGLFRWNKNTKTIDCPYILLWLLAAHCGDEDLQNLMLGDYKSEQHKIMPQKCGMGMQGWMHWEEFVARFRCIKSHVFNGDTVKWSDLHAGAQFGPGSEQLVKVEKLKLVYANRQYVTNTNNSNMLIAHQMNSEHLADANLLVMNGKSAPASDIFCALKLDNKKVVKEGIQCRHIAKTTTNIMLKSETEKCKFSEDFFLYITTGPQQEEGLELDAKCAFVHDSQFKKYFGPYAGRAFMCQQEAPNINTASRTKLASVDGVGDKRADEILKKRCEREFQDVDDCYTRTKIPKNVLERFKF